MPPPLAWSTLISFVSEAQTNNLAKIFERPHKSHMIYPYNRRRATMDGPPALLCPCSHLQPSIDPIVCSPYYTWYKPYPFMSANASLTSKMLHFQGSRPLGSPFAQYVLYHCLRPSGSRFVLLLNKSFRSSQPGVLPLSSAHGWP